MVEKPKKQGPITAAAAALEADLVAVEAAAAEVARVRLDTRKNLERAGRELQDAAAIFTRLQERVNTFMNVLNDAQDRLIQVGTSLRDVGTEIQRRQEHYVQAQAACDALTQQVAVVTALAAEGPEHLAEVRDGLVSLADSAGALAEAAREAGFRDIVHDAAAREQQLRALANRLGIA